MNSVHEGIFVGFCAFRKVFLGVVQVTKYFLGSPELSNSADPCL